MDIQTRFIDFQTGCDWTVTPQGLAQDTALDSAIIISLFTDARALPTDEYSGDPRGYWADALTVTGETPVRLGSRLWLLRREKQIPATLRRAEQYAREALQWLIDDGIAQSIAIAASAPRNGVLLLDIQIDNKPFNYEVAV